MDNELLTLPRLARRLGVSQSWLRQEAASGRIPCLAARGRYLFSESAVRSALLQRAERPKGADHE